MAIALAQDQELQGSGNAVVVLDHKDKRSRAGLKDGRAHADAHFGQGVVPVAGIREGCRQRRAALSELIQSQLLDPFRIGLLIALVVTMVRTAQVTGRLVPLVLGAIFVAVIIPSTNPPANATLTESVLAGLVSNGIILAIILAVVVVVRRMRG